MGRRRKNSTLEDWIDVVAMLPWWACVLLALASYMFLSGVAEQGAKPTITTTAELGSHAAKTLWSTLAWFGQYLVPGVCLMGAVVSAVNGRSSGRGQSSRAGLGGADMVAKPVVSEESHQAVVAFGVFFSGVALLVLTRLTQSTTIHALMGSLRVLGWTLLVVGFVISMLVAWRMVFGVSKGADLPERADESEATSSSAAQDGQPALTDSVAEQYGVMYGQRASPKGIEKIESAADVEKMLDIIEWRRFEAVVERCYQLKGFSTSTKEHGADGGVDIKLYSEDNPDDLAGVVQCKHWGRRYVGVEQLRALRGSMAEFRASQGYFVTSSTFTPDAMEFARGNQIETVNRDQLVGLLMRFRPDERDSVLKVALTGRYEVPTCASCGTKMVKRTPRRGGQAFWGCVSYPRCRSVIRIGRGK